MDMMEYRLFLESPGMMDVIGKMWNMLQMVLVEFPFMLLRIIVSSIRFLLDLLDWSNDFSNMRKMFFDQSRFIYQGFVGGSNGRISTNSLAFSFLMIAIFYLTWHFFFGKGNFSKKAIHVVIVVLLGFAYFGNINTEKGAVSGGMYLFETVDNVSNGLKKGIITGFTAGTDTDSDDERKGYVQYFEDYIVKSTFYYINSGSANGEYQRGKKLDENKLVPSNDLTQEELEKFKKEREDYLGEIAKENPYVRNTQDYLVQKAVMVALGYGNVVVLGFPILFTNLTISAFQLILLLFILLFPLALIASFIPFMRNAAFRFLKMMLGILFLPVLLAFLLSVIFYLNKVIDTLILAKAGDLMNNGVAFTIDRKSVV